MSPRGSRRFQEEPGLADQISAGGVISAVTERGNPGRDALHEFRCPRCGLSLQVRMAVEHCPRCLARERLVVRLERTSVADQLPRDGEED